MIGCKHLFRKKIIETKEVKSPRANSGVSSQKKTNFRHMLRKIKPPLGIQGVSMKDFTKEQNQTESELKTVTGRKVFPYTKYNWLFAAVSIFFFAVSLYVIFVKGINFGVDFQGGAKMTYTFKSRDINAEKITQAVDELKLGEAQVIRFGNDLETNQYMIRVKYVEGKNIFEMVSGQLKKSFGDENVQVLS